MTSTKATQELNRYERHDAVPGATVQSMDGKKLGTVSRTRGESFKVHTGLFHKDYWLESALISSADESTVVVAVLDRDMDQYKLLDAIDTDDALLNSEEMEEQRRRMERELDQRH